MSVSLYLCKRSGFLRHGAPQIIYYYNYDKDGRLQSLEQRMQGLEAQNILMRDEVQGLRANVSALVQEVQSLKTKNGDLKQRLREYLC